MAQPVKFIPYFLFANAFFDYSTAMENELASRLEKVESNLAHLEHQYDQLNQVVLEQSKQLDKLQALQQRVSQTVENIELERIKNTNSRPPHYQ